jgi:YCII-related domain
MPAPRTYLAVTRVRGPAWDPARSMREQQEWLPHAEFMDELADSGFIAFGGPLGDEERFLMVCDAPDEATVRARFADDPWVPLGLLEIERVERWTILLEAPPA